MIRASSVVLSRMRGWQDADATVESVPLPPPGALRRALLAVIDEALRARNLVDHDDEADLSAAFCALDAYLATPEARLLCPVVACLSAHNFETLVRDVLYARRRRAASVGPSRADPAAD